MIKIQIGPYIISPLSDIMRDPATGLDVTVTGKLWICKEDGEGMETTEEKLVEALNTFWEREF